MDLCVWPRVVNGIVPGLNILEQNDCLALLSSQSRTRLESKLSEDINQQTERKYQALHCLAYLNCNNILLSMNVCFPCLNSPSIKCVHCASVAVSHHKRSQSFLLINSRLTCTVTFVSKYKCCHYCPVSAVKNTEQLWQKCGDEYVVQSHSIVVLIPLLPFVIVLDITLKL